MLVDPANILTEIDCTGVAKNAYMNENHIETHDDWVAFEGWTYLEQSTWLTFNQNTKRR